MKLIWTVLMSLLGVYGQVPCAMAEMDIHTEQDVRYVTGGMTPEERKEMKKLAPRFPIHLFFAAKGHEGPVEGVNVTVRNVEGTVILKQKSQGPLFFVEVIGGRYTIDAEYDGETQSETKDLTGRRYLQLRFIFNEGPDAQ